ncbi:prephenate dehydratase domain-containing protein [Sphingomonas parva]|uniref:prephenate dehydratase domain-containing protein n=1 Tax=Sphingomonas parva TaxID=2555898 RepID=UPI0014311589|nr:prephenate dehydratase domain-containing protein [Sphingomonas parva]
MRVAYQGAPGSFGHQAALAFCRDCAAEARETFEAVAAAVARGEAERGVLPVENSRAGTVAGVAEIIAESGVRVLSEHDLPVRMHLLALPGVSLEQVRSVVSHPVALKQCAETLAALGLAGEAASNTAVAARALAARDQAVLASEAAAAAYGLVILRRDLQDDPGNATRFAIIAAAGAVG